MGSNDRPAILLLHDAPAQRVAALADRLAQEGYDVRTGRLAAGGVPDRGAMGVVLLGGGARLPEAAAGGAAVTVVYDALGVPGGVAPLVVHLAGAHPEAAADAARLREAGVEVYDYPEARAGFALAAERGPDRLAADLAWSRTLAALRGALGPRHNLSDLWDRHCAMEFATRDVAGTMATMVAEPYVNSVPVMTGGVGQRELTRFYRHHFVDRNPADTRIVPISRTVGADRIVDEVLFCFTHDIEMDWMLPGIAPTGRKVEVPLVAIVHFQGDKLAHEHIYWDQASVLVQIGALDPHGLPVTGREQAHKLLDERIPSNRLMGPIWQRSEGGAS